MAKLLKDTFQKRITPKSKFLKKLELEQAVMRAKFESERMRGKSNVTELKSKICK